MAKPASQPPTAGQLKSTIKIPSLKTLQTNAASAPKPKTADKQEQEELILKNEPFTMAMLQATWNEYAGRYKEEGKKSEVIILERPIELEDQFTVKLKLDNFVQLDQLNSFKPDLLRFLRQALKNSNIMLEAVIASDDSIKMIYTSNDKFKYLSEKYPILEEMKKKFGLDTDF